MSVGARQDKGAVAGAKPAAKPGSPHPSTTPKTPTPPPSPTYLWPLLLTPPPLHHTHQYHACLCGSISSCDAFLNVFQSKGLRAEVICPCASSPEALTVAIR
ncbi:hypothetical protein JZ751_021966, partial [Albula glossodonta]